MCCWISEVQQLPELKRCLDSVERFRVILINGKWYDVKGKHPISIREARELIDSYPNVLRINYPGHHEWEARNKYLEQCSDHDTLIVLDTDEYLQITGYFEKYITSLPSFKVKGYDARRGGIVRENRGIRYPGQTRHRDRHNELWWNGEKLTFEGDPPEHLLIHHDKSYRSPHITQIMKERNRLRPYR